MSLGGADFWSLAAVKSKTTNLHHRLFHLYSKNVSCYLFFYWSLFKKKKRRDYDRFKDLLSAPRWLNWCSTVFFLFFVLMVSIFLSFTEVNFLFLLLCSLMSRLILGHYPLAICCFQLFIADVTRAFSSSFRITCVHSGFFFFFFCVGTWPVNYNCLTLLWLQSIPGNKKKYVVPNLAML